MIYFLRRSDGNIKIGMTGNYKQRLWALMGKYGQLELLGLMDGDYELEAILHNTFQDQRVDTDGREWFAPSAALLDYIAKNTHRNIPDWYQSIITMSGDTQQRLRDLANGMGLTYDGAINYLIDQITREGESAVEAGVRLRAEAQRKYPNEIAGKKRTKRKS